MAHRILLCKMFSSVMKWHKGVALMMLLVQRHEFGSALRRLESQRIESPPLSLLGGQKISFEVPPGWHARRLDAWDQTATSFKLEKDGEARSIILILSKWPFSRAQRHGCTTGSTFDTLGGQKGVLRVRMEHEITSLDFSILAGGVVVSSELVPVITTFSADFRSKDINNGERLCRQIFRSLRILPFKIGKT